MKIKLWLPVVCSVEVTVRSLLSVLFVGLMCLACLPPAGNSPSRDVPGDRGAVGKQ